jgi:hypothetical protein
MGPASIKCGRGVHLPVPVAGGMCPALNAYDVRSLQGLGCASNLHVTKAEPLTQCVAWASLIMTSTVPRALPRQGGTGGGDKMALSIHPNTRQRIRLRRNLR